MTASLEYPQARAQGCPFDPAPALRDVQAEAPLTRIHLWDGSTPWLVTRYQEMRALLSDPRVSSDINRDGYPVQSAAIAVRRRDASSFIVMDDPDHARLRRMITAPFAIKRVEAMRPAIQRITDELIDDLLAGPKPADLVKAFALPVPSRVICDLLGVPYDDHDFFQRNSSILLKRGTSAEEGAAAQKRLLDYLDELLGHKLADPGEDVLSDLAVQRVRTGELSRNEAARMGMLLLVAGHETTANMIALGTLALLEHPDQLAALRETDDPRLVAGAVEEMLRYLTITHSGRRRVALADIEIAGQTIRAGEGIVLAGETANRDPAVFADPDQLDIHRDARRHVAFGFGVHQCLGQPLARVELQVVYGTLFRRIPTLRRAVDLDEIPFKHDGQVYGVYELPVTW
ncbi:cytochrome P450 [Amycolatopsis pithecellobii]|uniref:Cytochrome P450 n=1 Tax=Amycolatopsis pithecellobii TaxID=664692 RepID=A0A6N7YYA1_9PSEU|nr:cytochrome P450 [Amycolatopsis pithecellobii]MTD53329.1 cytochrome P450 [Amycolatopsis pithecellobii]